jgi:hypothetical protein
MRVFTWRASWRSGWQVGICRNRRHCTAAEGQFRGELSTPEQRGHLRQALQGLTLDASGGKQERYRLNRRGDDQAHSALWRIVFTRMVCDPRFQHHIERRLNEGWTKETARCLKRYVAREYYAHLLE